MKNHSLKQDYFWNTLGVFLQNAVSPILLIITTRINGIYDSGIFSFAFSIAVIFLSLGMWGGRTFQASDARKEFSSQSYITVRLLLSVVMFVGAILFSVVNNYDLFKTGVIVSLVLVKVIESVSDAVYAVMQVNEKLYKSGKSLMYKAILSFVIFIVIDLMTHNLLLSCIGLVVANIIVFALYDIPVVYRLENSIFQNRWSNKVVIEALKVMKISLPIFGVTFLAMFSLNIPRYFLDIYHPGEIAYFGILAMPITLIILAVSFLLQPNVVFLSRLYREGHYKRFNRIVTKLLLATVCIILIALITVYFLGVPVLHIVFGLDFSSYHLALMIMVAGAGANAIVAVFMSIMVIIRRFKTPFLIFLLTNILLTVLSVVEIKQHGLIGSVILFAGTNILQAALFISYYSFLLKKAERE